LCNWRRYCYDWYNIYNDDDDDDDDDDDERSIHVLWNCDVIAIAMHTPNHSIPYHIGDPSGRNTERALLSQVDVDRNQAGIMRNVQQILNNNSDDTKQQQRQQLAPVRVMNNIDWWASMKYNTIIPIIIGTLPHYLAMLLIPRDATCFCCVGLLLIVW
jgi:hypothetical protein